MIGHSRVAPRWIRAYGLALLAVAVASGLALYADLHGLARVPTPLFLIAIGVSIWYGGRGPGVVAIVLATLSFAFFIAEPRYSFTVDAADRDALALFAVFAVLIGWFAATRVRIEEDLRRTRDELQQANAALQRRTLELESANKELEAFAYSTSHDLRAPLRHVAGFSELLQKHAAGTLDEKSRRYVAMLLESAKKMGLLIDDLLAFSRIGRAEAQNTLVSLEQVLREVLREVERDTDGRDIAWTVGELPTVHGDRAMLRIALANLVANAAKFTRTRPRAEIEIGSQNGKPDEVVVFVKDNGVGFDMKYVGKLFGVFQRLHRPETFEGTGIGLATVQRIVTRHGGRVWAEGAVEGGATFYFSMPKL